MIETDAANLGLLILRLTLGVVMLAHGINHIFGGGKIAGTAGWFESPVSTRSWFWTAESGWRIGGNA